MSNWWFDYTCVSQKHLCRKKKKYLIIYSGESPNFGVHPNWTPTNSEKLDKPGFLRKLEKNWSLNPTILLGYAMWNVLKDKFLNVIY